MFKVLCWLPRQRSGPKDGCPQVELDKQSMFSDAAKLYKLTDVQSYNCRPYQKALRVPLRCLTMGQGEMMIQEKAIDLQQVFLELLPYARSCLRASNRVESRIG